VKVGFGDFSRSEEGLGVTRAKKRVRKELGITYERTNKTGIE
jgi:hypothetical protein